MDGAGHHSPEHTLGSPNGTQDTTRLQSPVSTTTSKLKEGKKTLDFDPMRKLSYPNIQVTPRYHMVIDKPIEKDTDKCKLFT